MKTNEIEKIKEKTTKEFNLYLEKIFFSSNEIKKLCSSEDKSKRFDYINIIKNKKDLTILI